MPNRVEREIEEILVRLDEFVPKKRRTRRLGQRLRAIPQSLAVRLRSLTRGMTGGHAVLWAAVIIVAAVFLRGAFPDVARLMMYVGVFVIFAAIVMSIWPSRGRPKQRYWRGQPVDLSGSDPWTRLRGWWRRRNRRY